MLSKIGFPALSICVALIAASLSVALAPATGQRQIAVYLAAGQSNSVGAGDGYGPRVPTGHVLQFWDGQVRDANDPVGMAQTGSAWPAFGTTYHQLTGADICVVSTGWGGSWQVAPADAAQENWDVSGKLFGRSIAIADAAIDALRSRGYAPRIGGILWAQGESDGASILHGKLSRETFSRALALMVGRFRHHYGKDVPFYIFLPAPGEGSDIIGELQEQFALNDSRSTVVYRDTSTFLTRGLMQHGLPHYKQAGYDDMGRVGATRIVAAEASR
jgi:hypothetical protein